MTEQVPPLAVYVHWPYCARICPYCDFNVVRDRGQAEQADLAAAIVADLHAQARVIGPRRLASVFLGGGTPSLMDPRWTADIIAAARALWPAGGEVEVSLEANPTDAEAERFEAFRRAGVGRVSLGVQSLDDGVLKFLGRNHSAAQARRATRVAAEVFPRVSLDMIYAHPDQTPRAWAAELAEAIALGPEHISPYQLTIEQGTAFDRLTRRGTLVPPTDTRGAELYETTQTVLGAAGYEAYEVSNHARGEAARSVHNLAYWRGWDYVGAGPGAHGRLTTAEGRIATTAQARPKDYIAAVAGQGTGFAMAETLSPREVAIERLLLGLRSVEGTPLADVGAVLDRENLASATHARLVDVTDRIVATPAGRVVLDRLTADLIA